MANRRRFITDNQLGVGRYAVILVGFAALLVLFGTLGNVGLIQAALSAQDTARTAREAQEIMDQGAATQQARIDAELERRAAQGDARVALYGYGDVADLFAAQLFMSKHDYVAADHLGDDVPGILDVDVVFVAAEELSAADVAWLAGRVSAGCTVLFGELPASIESDGALRELLGVRRVDGWHTYEGLRMSSELLDGSLVEDPERPISAWNVKLTGQTKVYACALPEGYEDQRNDDLPPLVWRYIASNDAGTVYACNGDFVRSEIAYALMPLVMREARGSYLYPIVNAYCVFVDGFPYADNEEREMWRQLYSRDKLGIQSDMLMPEFERFAQMYGSRITYYSDDYERFRESDDERMSYYTRQIAAQGGQLALRCDGELYPTSPTDAVLVDRWTAPYRLWDVETQSYELPLNCVVTVENYTELPDLFCLASITGAIGYYAVCIDVDDFLDTTTEAAYWSAFTEWVEVLFGTHQRDYDWIERVTANEAVGRINRLLNMQVRISYGEEDITATIENFDGQAWFILRTNHENLVAEGAELRTVGEGVYLVSATDATVTLRWSDGI